MLMEPRNKIVFGFDFWNVLWSATMTAMNEVKYILNIAISQSTSPPITTEPLRFAFL